MPNFAYRIGYGLAVVSLATLSGSALAQRTTANRPAAGTRTTHAKTQTQVQRKGSTTVNNTNRNVTRNVNSNNTVNVNRNVNVDVHTWGRAPVRAGVYAWPRGYAYVRRPVGYILPRPFLTSAYYYSGWAALGLAAPMAGYQWVRYGSDLLLVQVATGRVADVRYGVFG